MCEERAIEMFHAMWDLFPARARLIRKDRVELTMNELVKIFTSLGVEIFGNVGDGFDPNLHNAVMHIENEELGENTISQVFQKGFKIGDKVVRFAMVQVAN